MTTVNTQRYTEAVVTPDYTTSGCPHFVTEHVLYNGELCIFLIQTSYYFFSLNEKSVFLSLPKTYPLKIAEQNYVLFFCIFQVSCYIYTVGDIFYYLRIRQSAPLPFLFPLPTSLRLLLYCTEDKQQHVITLHHQRSPSVKTLLMKTHTMLFPIWK